MSINREEEELVVLVAEKEDNLLEKISILSCREPWVWLSSLTSSLLQMSSAFVRFIVHRLIFEFALISFLVDDG